MNIWIPATVVAVFGLAFGSFLNVCISRIPEGESVVLPGSHCPRCGHPIRWYDNIPIFSFLLLAGRCRDCRAPISVVYPLVEFLTSAILTLAFWRFRLSPEFIKAAFAAATRGSTFEAQARGGTPQTDKIQAVNSGANPYRVIRDWAHIDGRAWGGSNAVAVDCPARISGKAWPNNCRSRTAPSISSRVLARSSTSSTNRARCARCGVSASRMPRS